MTFDKIAFGEMTFDKIAFGEMTFDELTFDEIAFGERTKLFPFSSNGLRRRGGRTQVLHSGLLLTLTKNEKKSGLGFIDKVPRRLHERFSLHFFSWQLGYWNLKKHFLGKFFG
jgi:hypothetical protein